MSSSAFVKFAFFLIIVAIPVAAQKRPAGPAPVLVDVIGGTADVSPLPKPKKTRVFGAPLRSGRIYDLERRIFDLLNEQRTANKMAPLVWNDQIAEIARVHSQSMADYKFFSHRDMDGLTVDGRAESYGLSDWRGIGENIATLQGFDDPAVVAVEKWMQSPGHRQNILGARWSESAIGIAAASDGTYYFTQVFLFR